MSEDFLHYIWKFQLFTKVKFQIGHHKNLSIIHQGVHNHNAGPDFLNAKIQLDSIVWNGAVEIHIRSSDWYKHNHQTDEKYNNVVLHVVWEHDQDVILNDKSILPTLEIKQLIVSNALENYNQLMTNLTPIACQNFIANVNPITVFSAKERAVIKRLEQKALLLEHRLSELQNDWEQLTFERIAYCFGLKINAQNFESLAQQTSIKILQKHKDSLVQIEAILFGQAGLLTPKIPNHNYYNFLQREYSFLQAKYGLKSSLKNHDWNMLRLRPASFPSLRIALLASLWHQKDGLFSILIQENNLKKLEKIFETKASEYWDNHFIFAKETTQLKTKKIGNTLFNLIIINAVIPLLYLYGIKKDSQNHKNVCLDLLEQIKPEDNKITRMWTEIGIENKSAFDSQALIELYNTSCITKSCLSCNIGSSILQKV